MIEKSSEIVSCVTVGPDFAPHLQHLVWIIISVGRKNVAIRSRSIISCLVEVKLFGMQRLYLSLLGHKPEKNIVETEIKSIRKLK